MRVLCVQHQDDCPPGLVGDRLRERGATLQVVAARSPRLPDPTGFDLVLPLGSDDSAADETVPYLGAEFALLARAVAAGVPVFGICFGAQLLCRVLGGQVARMAEPEIGWLPVRSTRPELVATGPWLAWHLDAMAPGPGSTTVARTSAAVAAFVHGPHVGVQFHPEATPASARVWAGRYREAITAAGGDPDGLVAQTEQWAVAARVRAGLLVDRVLAAAAVRGAIPAAGG